MKKSDAEAVVAYVEGVTRVAYSGSTYEREAQLFKAKVAEPSIGAPPPPMPPPPPPPLPTVTSPLALWRAKEAVLSAAWALMYGSEQTLAHRTLVLKSALIALERLQ